jgi:DNA-binding transcriptional MocR family regulator
MFTTIPADTQKTVASLLRRESFLDSFFVENKKNLTEASERVIERLRAGGVRRFVAAEAGMFIYCNLLDREGYTGPMTADAERELWVSLLRQKRVFILPGFVFEDTRRGWFRICFTAHPIEDTLHAIDRLLAHLQDSTA